MLQTLLCIPRYHTPSQLRKVFAPDWKNQVLCISQAIIRNVNHQEILLPWKKKKQSLKKSTEKETSLTAGFSKWCELFLGVVQAFSLHSLFVFIKLILYKRAFEARDLHFMILKKLEKRSKFRNILLNCGKQLYYNRNPFASSIFSTKGK